MRDILHHPGFVLEHLSAFDRLPVHPPDPRPDRPWRPPGDAARADDRGLGTLSRVRHPVPAGPWRLLAQPRRRRLLRPPDASARPGSSVPVRRTRVPAPDLRRTAARRRPDPGAPDRPAARGAPDHRPGAGRQSRRAPRRRDGRADQPHDAAEARAHRRRRARSRGERAGRGRLGLAQGPALRHHPGRPGAPARGRPAARPQRRHAGGVAGGRIPACPPWSATAPAPMPREPPGAPRTPSRWRTDGICCATAATPCARSSISTTAICAPRRGPPPNPGCRMSPPSRNRASRPKPSGRCGPPSGGRGRRRTAAMPASPRSRACAGRVCR